MRPSIRPNLRPLYRTQRGAALMVMLVIVVLGITAVLLNSLNSSSLKNARQGITTDAMAQAKDALIGYAVTYRDNDHSDQVFGYLPLPDLGSSRNNNMSSEEGNAAANFSGNTKNLTVIGRLPWRALGLSPLRDSHGECLWYAVSGSFQNTQKAAVLNWDSIGHFDPYTSNGTSSGTVSTTGANYAQRPVAIIFSAGAVLQGQNRQISTSTTDRVSTCGGNYDVHNYLDSFNTSANINNIVNYFAGSTKNSIGYAYNLANSSDGSRLVETALTAPKKIIFGDIEVNGEKITNDRILTITADEIFQLIQQRNDFATDINTLISSLAACLNALSPALLPEASLDAKGVNSPLSTCPESNAQKTNIRNNWKENLLYAKPSGTITLNGTTCNAVLIFGGARSGIQTRVTALDKDNAINYLESANFTSFPNGTTYSGASAYNKASPSSDIIACINGTSSP